MKKRLKSVIMTICGLATLLIPMQAFAEEEEIETKTETYYMPVMSNNNPAYVDTSIVPDSPTKMTTKKATKVAVKKQVKKIMKKSSKKAKK